MNILHKLHVWLSTKRPSVLRTAGWAIVIGNIYLALTLPFLPFITTCFDNVGFTIYRNYNYRFLSSFVEGSQSGWHSFSVFFHSIPNPFSTTVTPNQVARVGEGNLESEMTVLVSPNFWFDSYYLSNSGGRIAMNILQEDAGKSWWDFEDEIALLFPDFRFKSVCAAFHIVATEGRIPNEEDVRRELHKLYSYIDSSR